MIFTLWHNYLYVPLFNLLFWLYGTVAAENMGLAVVFLTIIIRILLLPLSVIDEWRLARLASISNRVEKLRIDYGKDIVAFKLHIRKLLRKNKLTPWAAIILLAVQALILVLLYQVMTGGLNAEQFGELYQGIPHPTGAIDTSFLGTFDTARSNIWVSLGVAVILFWRIIQDQFPRRNLLTNRDRVYRYAFPLFTFTLLAILPSVKTVFILTSMLFSAIIHSIRTYVTAPPKSVAVAPKPVASHLPSVRDRFSDH